MVVKGKLPTFADASEIEFKSELFPADGFPTHAISMSDPIWLNEFVYPRKVKKSHACSDKRFLNAQIKPQIKQCALNE